MPSPWNRVLGHISLVQHVIFAGEGKLGSRVRARLLKGLRIINKETGKITTTQPGDRDLVIYSRKYKLCYLLSIKQENPSDFVFRQAEPKRMYGTGKDEEKR